MKRLTRSEALRILIRNAAQNVAGSGVGLRSALDEEQRQWVADAINRVHQEAFGRVADSGDFYNLRTPQPTRNTFGRPLSATGEEEA